MTRPPNILLIYTDQQRYDTIGALGNPAISTPNLDRLVAEGVAFTHATTPCPVCMPARWSLHSGQWTTTHHCYSNHHPGLRPPTDIPSMLREAGYRTGLIGKNHSFLRPDDFDVWDEHPLPRDQDAWGLRLAWAHTVRDDRYFRLAEEAAPGGVLGDPERAKTDRALDFIAAHADTPFFLWLSYLYPHTPYEVPEPFFSMYHASSQIPTPRIEPEGLEMAGKPFRQSFHQRNNDAILPFTQEQVMTMRRVYYGMISFVDAEIGRLLDALGSAGLLDDTLLVFSSDHGDYMGDHGLLTKSPALYDCLVRVPLIARWPGHIDTDRRDARFASHVDLMPTFAAAAGIVYPEQVQGVNLLPCLSDGGNGGEIRPAAYSEYGIPGVAYDAASLREEGLHLQRFTNPWNENLPWEGNPVALSGRIRMIRTRRWKYVEEVGGTSELYDLSHDPYELVNLWDDPQYFEVQKGLERHLQEWLKQVEAHPGQAD